MLFTIIVKNSSGSPIFINDLGISIPAQGQVELSELFGLPTLWESNDLYTLVSDDDLVVNDGTDDLDTIPGLNWISISEEEAGGQKLEDHIDVSAPPSSGKYILESDDETYGWIETPASQSSSVKNIYITFGSRDSNYWNVDGTTYWIACRFVFLGSDILGTPTTFECIGLTESSSTITVMLMDYTNNLEIATVTTSSTDAAIMTTTSIANIPTGKAIFGIRAKNSGIFKDGKLFSAGLYF